MIRQQKNFSLAKIQWYQGLTQIVFFLDYFRKLPTLDLMLTRPSNDHFLNMIIQNLMVRSAKSKVGFWKLYSQNILTLVVFSKKISISSRCVTSCHRKQAEWISGKVGAGNVCGVWAFLPLASEGAIQDFWSFEQIYLYWKRI